MQGGLDKEDEFAFRCPHGRPVFHSYCRRDVDNAKMCMEFFFRCDLGQPLFSSSMEKKYKRAFLDLCQLGCGKIDVIKINLAALHAIQSCDPQHVKGIFESDPKRLDKRKARTFCFGVLFLEHRHLFVEQAERSR